MVDWLEWVGAFSGFQLEDVTGVERIEIEAEEAKEASFWDNDSALLVEHDDPVARVAPAVIRAIDVANEHDLVGPCVDKLRREQNRLVPLEDLAR